MSSGSNKIGPGGGKAGQPNPILLDKFNGRRSTPDSEALASSDDEVERLDHQQPAMPPQKPTRRASWLNDTTQSGTQPRKGSFASSSMSPTTSHPSTPSAESSNWGSHSQGGVGRGHAGSNSFPWGSGIWNSESRKEPPSRMTEILPSPTSIHPPGSAGNGYFGDSIPSQRDQPGNPTIPFAIPLHPTPKTYRSQSYSVGQLDPDSPAGSSTSTGPTSTFTGRGRPLQHSGLQHRPSRPSMLSEMSNEGGLSKLKEVDDDDDESTNGSTQGVQLQSNEAKTIEILARENAMLRQQQYQNRIRPRSSTNAYSLGNGYGMQEPVPEESDYAIDELDEISELQDITNKGLLGRRMSEYGAGQRVSPYTSLENRKLENVKKAYWQSSLGFGGLADIPQSRRHSFADVPTRHGSVSSVGDPLATHESNHQENLSPTNRYQEASGFDHGELTHLFDDYPSRSSEQARESIPAASFDFTFSPSPPVPSYPITPTYPLPSSFPNPYFFSPSAPFFDQNGGYQSGSYQQGGHQISSYQYGSRQIGDYSFYSSQYTEPYSHQQFPAASYFGGPSSLARNVDPYSAYPSAYPSYGMPSQYGGGRPASPHRNMYGVAQPRHNQLLYIVLFKCSRADVFYVQEGTGLSVKPGDLVIVEADRGTDLGTVARDNVDWATAKELKEHYAEEHYKWLMMYSQGAAGNSDGTGAGLMAASNGLQGSAVGGMGPPSQHGMQEPNPGEIKPKIIKRLAQNHEIQALRDKEGNEAKAKRVCMQKVKEHGLHMEILDAEFQMDWKKLTFYYFADAYINFNSLVTDLFKVYKTRIWMSAINPASFASPSLGLQAPSGIGPGAVGVSRTAQSERRPPPEQPSYGPPPAGRGGAYQGVFAQPFTSALERQAMPPTAFQPSPYTYGYSPFAAAPRNVGVSPTGYVPGLIDPFAGFNPSADYQALPVRFPSPHGSTPNHEGNEYGRQSSGNGTPNADWISSFQGLSMNSR